MTKLELQFILKQRLKYFLYRQMIFVYKSKN